MIKKRLMRNPSESQAGFTLIELMIVVAIIGILAAIAIPNFLKAMSKATWTGCVQSVSGLKVAMEMYISDNGEYTDDPDLLAIYMIPGCEEADGSDCGGFVESRVRGELTEEKKRDKACKDFNIVVMKGGYDYEISATGSDRYFCELCVSPRGMKPEKYTECDSTSGPQDCSQN